MTVHELIEELQLIEDKSKNVYFEVSLTNIEYVVNTVREYKQHVMLER